MGDSYYVDCSIKGKLYRLALSIPYNINRIVEISDFAVVFTYDSNGEEKILRVKQILIFAEAKIDFRLLREILVDL